MVPVAGCAMLAGQNRLPHELVSWVALKGDGLPHVVASTHHHPMAKRLGVWTFLELIG